MLFSKPLFYGWRIVSACFITAVVLWSLTVFGASFYLQSISQSRGWSIALISSGVTLFYLTSAVFSMVVANAIVTFGPTLVTICGSIPLAVGVIGLGRANQPWQVYVNFALLGISYAALGATAISTTLAPWFERYQGRAVSAALMGASVGGMTGVPLLVLGSHALGFPQATLVAGLVSLAIIIPLALTVLKHRPQDLSLFPDGEAPTPDASRRVLKAWTLAESLRTPMLCSVVVAFGGAMAMQLGFLTHQLSLGTLALGEAAASATVSATGLAALMGRLIFSYFVDRANLRTITVCLFAAGSAAFASMAWIPANSVFIGASIVFGITLGNVTALSPILIRREFGAGSFGLIYGFAAAGIGITSSFGPTIWGILHDAYGGYRTALQVSAAIDLFAAIVVFVGRPAAKTY